MKNLIPFAEIAYSKIVEFSKSDLVPGLNDVGDYFIRLDSEGSNVEYVIDKICDHAGGKLQKKDGEVVCPLHNWHLNQTTLKYRESHICKKKIPFKIDGNLVCVEENHRELRNPNPITNPELSLQFRWLNHACIWLSCNGTTLITDPWLLGNAFLTGWWLQESSPLDSIELLRSADYIYISHNHPDHYHEETLQHLPRDAKIIVPDFDSKSVERPLKKLGFTNLLIAPFSSIFELTPGFEVSILKSGDFRDDSGLYLRVGSQQILLTVDSNSLNNFILPRGIDLLMTSFASGASGFPICYSNYTKSEKKDILLRNKNAIKLLVKKYIEASNPTFYMPYAGMFKEKADRDKEVRDINIKNSVLDILAYVSKMGVETIETSMDKNLVLSRGKVSFSTTNREFLPDENIEEVIGAFKRRYCYNSEKILNYFRNCSYNGKQIVQIIPTDDHFEKLRDEVIFVDFCERIFCIVKLEDVVVSKENYKVMTLRVREEVLMCMIENMLPWEDISIGFQLRATREPNSYESDFWYYFTNEYIAKL